MIEGLEAHTSLSPCFGQLPTCYYTGIRDHSLSKGNHSQKQYQKESNVALVSALCCIELLSHKGSHNSLLCVEFGASQMGHLQRILCNAGDPSLIPGSGGKPGEKEFINKTLPKISVPNPSSVTPRLQRQRSAVLKNLQTICSLKEISHYPPAFGPCTGCMNGAVKFHIDCLRAFSCQGWVGSVHSCARRVCVFVGKRFRDNK